MRQVSRLARDARLSDAAALCEAERAIVREFDALLVSEPGELSEAAFAERIGQQSHGRTKFLVTELNGELVAHASLYPMGLRRVAQVLRLDMCVHLGHWGQRHGTRCWQTCWYGRVRTRMRTR